PLFLPGESQGPRTIWVRYETNLATAEPSVAVARDPVIDLVTYQRWNEVDWVDRPPKRKLSGNAQRGFGPYKSLAVRYEREGIRVVRIDGELLGERTPVGRLNCDEAEVTATVTFAYETAAAGTEDAYAIEQDQTIGRVHAARSIGIDNDWLACLHGISCF